MDLRISGAEENPEISNARVIDVLSEIHFSTCT